MDFDKTDEENKKFVAECFNTAQKITIKAVLHRISTARNLDELETFSKKYLKQLESESE